MLPMMSTMYYWRIRLNEETMKYCPNVTRISRPEWDSDYPIDDLFYVLCLSESFDGYFWNMRRLKSIKLLMKDDNSARAKYALFKLDKMSKFLGQLETFSIEIKVTDQNFIEELFQCRNVLSHLTGLDFPEAFHPIFAEVPQRCKNLKSLLFNFQNSNDHKPEISTLLASLQQLTSLKSLSFILPEDAKLFWNHLKPQSSLRYLTLKFNASDLMNVNNKDAVRHWGEIKELEVLELKILCGPAREIMLARLLTTNILKKVDKLRQLKVSLEGALDHLGFQGCCEPFVAEEVPHLYESMERFEYSLQNSSKEQDIKVDLKMTKLKFFRSLKEVKLDGDGVCYEDMDKIVDLLQENQKASGDYPMLEINFESKARPRWLGDTLQKISKVKRVDKNLKIAINLASKTETPRGIKDNRLVQIFEEFCENIQTVRTVKGLAICLNLHDTSCFYSLPVESVKRILDKHAGVRNVDVCLDNFIGSIEYVNMDGEKTQFLVKKS